MCVFTCVPHTWLQNWYRVATQKSSRLPAASWNVPGIVSLVHDVTETLELDIQHVFLSDLISFHSNTAFKRQRGTQLLMELLFNGSQNNVINSVVINTDFSNLKRGRLFSLCSVPPTDNCATDLCLKFTHCNCLTTASKYCTIKP